MHRSGFAVRASSGFPNIRNVLFVLHSGAYSGKEMCAWIEARLQQALDLWTESAVRSSWLTAGDEDSDDNGNLDRPGGEDPEKQDGDHGTPAEATAGEGASGGEVAGAGPSGGAETGTGMEGVRAEDEGDRGTDAEGFRAEDGGELLGLRGQELVEVAGGSEVGGHSCGPEDGGRDGEEEEEEGDDEGLVQMDISLIQEMEDWDRVELPHVEDVLFGQYLSVTDVQYCTLLYCASNGTAWSSRTWRTSCLVSTCTHHGCTAQKQSRCVTYCVLQTQHYSVQSVQTPHFSVLSVQTLHFSVPSVALEMLVLVLLWPCPVCTLHHAAAHCTKLRHVLSGAVMLSSCGLALCSLEAADARRGQRLLEDPGRPRHSLAQGSFGTAEEGASGVRCRADAGESPGGHRRHACGAPGV